MTKEERQDTWSGGKHGPETHLPLLLSPVRELTVEPRLVNEIWCSVRSLHSSPSSRCCLLSCLFLCFAKVCWVGAPYDTVEHKVTWHRSAAEDAASPPRRFSRGQDLAVAGYMLMWQVLSLTPIPPQTWTNMYMYTRVSMCTHMWGLCAYMYKGRSLCVWGGLCVHVGRCVCVYREVRG